MNANTFRIQTQMTQLGLGGKLLVAALAVLLLIGGFFISLFLLAVGGSIAAVALAKLWWTGKKLQRSGYQGDTVIIRETRHEHQGQVIDAEYHVKQE